MAVLFFVFVQFAVEHMTAGNAASMFISHAAAFEMPMFRSCTVEIKPRLISMCKQFTTAN